MLCQCRRPSWLAVVALAALGARAGLSAPLGAPAKGAVKVPTVEIDEGVWMPMMAFGSVNNSFHGGCTVVEAVKQWLQLGGRHIDTAYDYYTQPEVGQAIRESGVHRSEVFLTTKVPGPIGYKEVIDMITKESLPQLGLDYIDLVLIHFPCIEKKLFPNACGAKELERRVETWRGLLELQRAGKIRAAGVSNFDAQQLAALSAASGVAPAVNQVEWHLGYHNETLLAAMKSLGVVMEAWGSLTGPTAQNPGIPLDDSRLAAVAAGHNATGAQVALRWSTQRGVVPVTATCSRSHAAGDLEAFAFDLSAQDLATLDALQPRGASGDPAFLDGDSPTPPTQPPGAVLAPFVV